MRTTFSRRTFLKTGALTMGALATGFFSQRAGLSTAYAATTGANKVLIVYYSRTGNTRQLAKFIHEKVGGDLVELQTVTPYPDNYDALTKQAKQELQAKARPALSTQIPNMASYYTVFIGYPNWWSTVPTPVFTFLEQHDFSGKKLIPFCTHGGGRLGNSVADIKQSCPRAQVLEAFEVNGKNVTKVEKDVENWLRRIGVQG